MSKRLAAAGLVAGLVAGGAAGLVLAVPAISSAQSDPAVTTVTTAPPSTSGSTTAPATSGTSQAPVDRSQWMKDALAPLVSAGTITQAQADAVVDALGKAAPARGDRGPGGPGGRGMGMKGAGLEAAASAIGITTDELRTALQGGQTIAEVATAKGVEVQKVVDALVAELKAHLAEEVTAGEHTQAEADQILADATTRITDMVNGKAPMGRPGGDMGRHRGDDAGSDSTGSDSTDSGSTSSTTTN